jgi:hypothetical protein
MYAAWVAGERKDEIVSDSIRVILRRDAARKPLS